MDCYYISFKNVSKSQKKKNLFFWFLQKFLTIILFEKFLKKNKLFLSRQTKIKNKTRPHTKHSVKKFCFFCLFGFLIYFFLVFCFFFWFLVFWCCVFLPLFLFFVFPMASFLKRSEIADSSPLNLQKIVFSFFTTFKKKSMTGLWYRIRKGLSSGQVRQ